MGMWRLCWMVWTSWPGPRLKAELILADSPVPATGTYRSRGIDRMAACRPAGTRWATMMTSLRWPSACPNPPLRSPWRVSEPTTSRLIDPSEGALPRPGRCTELICPNRKAVDPPRVRALPQAGGVPRAYLPEPEGGVAPAADQPQQPQHDQGGQGGGDPATAVHPGRHLPGRRPAGRVGAPPRDAPLGPE